MSFSAVVSVKISQFGVGLSKLVNVFEDVYILLRCFNIDWFIYVYYGGRFIVAPYIKRIKAWRCFSVKYFILGCQIKVQSYKLYNIKYMIASTQVTNAEIFAFVVVLFFKLLSRKVLITDRIDNSNCYKVGYFLRK